MRHFTYSEFDQKGEEGSGQLFMDYLFLHSLDALRHKCDFPFVVTSGYRTPEYNNEISTTGLTGPHTTGKAADIAVSRKNARIVLQNAFEMGCFTGIGLNQKGDGRFIHLDTIEREEPAIWTY